jgi:arylformamidase
LWQNPEVFHRDFVGVSECGAEWLVEHGLRLLGTDYLSAAPFDNGIKPHRLLLGAEVILLEGLDLRAIKPGTYELICLPLKLTGLDGAPARAVLREYEA